MTIPNLVLGTALDRARVGIFQPTDVWARARFGIWVTPSGSDLPPPECWLLVEVTEEGALKAYIEEGLTTLIGLDDDPPLKARVPC